MARKQSLTGSGVHAVGKYTQTTKVTQRWEPPFWL